MSLATKNKSGKRSKNLSINRMIAIEQAKRTAVKLDNTLARKPGKGKAPKVVFASARLDHRTVGANFNEVFFAVTGAYIRKRRNALAMSQRTLAARMGVNLQTITNMESGAKSIGLLLFFRTVEWLHGDFSVWAADVREALMEEQRSGEKK